MICNIVNLNFLMFFVKQWCLCLTLEGALCWRMQTLKVNDKYFIVIKIIQTLKSISSFY